MIIEITIDTERNTVETSADDGYDFDGCIDYTNILGGWGCITLDGIVEDYEEWRTEVKNNE